MTIQPINWKELSRIGEYCVRGDGLPIYYGFNERIDQIVSWDFFVYRNVCIKHDTTNQKFTTEFTILFPENNRHVYCRHYLEYKQIQPKIAFEDINLVPIERNIWIGGRFHWSPKIYKFEFLKVLCEHGIGFFPLLVGMEHAFILPPKENEQNKTTIELNSLDFREM